MSYNVHTIANYFLYLDQQHNGDGISNLKLQKLVYYAQGFYSAIFDRPLFTENIEAWTHGPVVSDLYQTYKNHGSSLIPANQEMEPPMIDNKSLELLNEVYDVFGQYSAWKLRDMTHEDKPWIDHENDASTIPLSEITSHFKTRLN